MKYESIQVAVGAQDVDYVALGRHAGHKVRIRIRSNPYDFQCHAYADVWSATDLKWNRIGSIPPALMNTPASLCYRKDSYGGMANQFTADRLDLEKLIRFALD